MTLVHLHLLLNHVPVIGMLFVVFVLLVALRARNSDMGKLALVMLTGIAAVTAVVFLTGEPAEELVENITGVSRATIHDHEEAAEVAFIGTAIAGVLSAVGLWWTRGRSLPRWLAATTLAVSLGLAGLMGWTANLGGQIRHTEITAQGAAAERQNRVEAID